MRGGAILCVEVPYEDGDRDRGVDHYWAVKPPTDYWTYTDSAGNEREHEYSYSYRVMGSQDVVISSKDDIRGYRELLDYIEREMDDE